MRGQLNVRFCGKPVTLYVVYERTKHIFKIIAVIICVSSDTTIYCIQQYKLLYVTSTESPFTYYITRE